MPHSSKKNVIMLMVDTLMDSSIQPAIESGKAPALKYFMEKGHYYPDLICPFPTMSVNVDSTLLTGVYCDKHKIPGLVWYHQGEKRIVNYGSTVKELFKLGIRQSVRDVFYNLNHVHLSKQHKTIHEKLSDQGIQTASINALLYRGSYPGYLRMPVLLSSLTDIERDLKTYRPELFSYGFIRKQTSLQKNISFWPRYGFNDQFSVNELKSLISEDNLPRFSIVYFPDLDKSVHKNGRRDIKGIEKADNKLQQILNSYPTWDDALVDNIWIILGDNGQAWVHQNRQKAIIDLRKQLGSYRIVKLSKGVMPEDEIVLGVNERMAYIYTLNPRRLPLDKIANILKQDDRIDVIAFKDGKSVTVMSGVYDGQLYFHPEGDTVDPYGQSWFIDGNRDILDIDISENNITYGDYPDALARLYASLVSHEGDYLAVSAKPGYEFKGESSPTHVGGGSHGGLHKQDSFVAMIVCGTSSLPKYLRTIDIKDWIESLV
ncbi:Type I phosphodiesterase / nucleotide pyrophosphatase [Lentibacillus halodurans]|uniref:Type I phosphodiesterase / nucleotide pyrophosphatase n=1 Tax=Lentibacillus halodurans TaxID=237679 RepID=A0A1I0Z9E3_9BACI|nr:alkaline phosphatase family protein [Lentibacillus halodurans]SFB22214.1 Type I phosphodiesterase / nucleotide pyrophosphatase [Lentibacillus halodurans]